MAKIVVFCSSSNLVSPMFLAEAHGFAKELVEQGHRLIYGGANCGMMGELARGALSAKGHVTGVIPNLDFAQSLNQEGLSDQVVVETLSERKVRMLQMADAAVALPGGLGTLDEIFEALVLKAAGEWSKPIVLYDFLQFWQPTVEALTLMVEQRMISRPLDELIAVAGTRAEVWSALKGDKLGQTAV